MAKGTVFNSNSPLHAQVMGRLRSTLRQLDFPPLNNKVLVALDIDGTIVDLDNNLPASALEQMLNVQASGAMTVIATGRGVAGLFHALKVIDEQCPPEIENPFRRGWAVALNGAAILKLDPDLPRGFEVYSQSLFDAASLAKTLSERLPSALFMVEPMNGPLLVSGEFPKDELWGEPKLVTIAELTANPVARLTLRIPGLSAQELAEHLRGFEVHGESFVVNHCIWLDIRSPGVSKASALQQICRATGIDEKYATAAVGDGDNDSEMLKWARFSAAMGQGDELAKAAALVSTTAVDDDGLALVIAALLEDR